MPYALGLSTPTVLCRFRSWPNFEPGNPVKLRQRIYIFAFGVHHFIQMPQSQNLPHSARQSGRRSTCANN
jgi:hypothetical protein